MEEGKRGAQVVFDGDDAGFPSTNHDRGNQDAPMALRLFQLVLKGGKWIRATRPLQLNYRPPTSTSFDTLATIPVSASLQAPVDLAGPRTDTPNASQVPVEVRTVPKPNKSFLGVTIPERPSPPKEGGELRLGSRRGEKGS